MPRLLKPVIACCLVMGLIGCSETKPLPNTDSDMIYLTARHLQLKQVPTTPLVGQNYVYCLGCLSYDFTKEVVFAVNPPVGLPADTKAVTAPFTTQVEFVSGALPTGVATATSSITVNSHS